MLSAPKGPAQAQGGAAMIEILVSIVITTFGLLALAGLQTKMNAALMESYQRSQAITLLQDMAQRIQTNLDQAASYVSGSAFGTGHSPASNCLTGATRAAVDLCEWSKALKGAAETAGGESVGAMIGARGCVEQIQAPNPAAGVCEPGIYRVTVAWQGLNSTVVPAVSCGANQYGSDDSLRKAITTQVFVPLPGCS